MAIFQEIHPEAWGDNVFKRIGADWMLVGAATEDGMNLMTAGWGGMGILWGRPVAFVFLRPQRYTRELADRQERLSLTFYGEEYREQLKLCGTKSGRDIGKVDACGFDLLYEGDVPYPAQAEAAVICKKLYRQPMEPGCFLDMSIPGKWYPEQDYHIMYVAEIEKILVKA